VSIDEINLRYKLLHNPTAMGESRKLSHLQKLRMDLVRTHEFDLAVKSDGLNLSLPKKIAQKIKLIDCGGNPKPHQLTMVPYVFNNWHQVN